MLFLPKTRPQAQSLASYSDPAVNRGSVAKRST